jgi:hypothetical protein
MQRTAQILSILTLLTTPAIPQSKHIHEVTDPYNGRKTLTLADISTRACPGDPSIGPHDGDLYLSVTATQLPNHQVAFFLGVDIYHGPILSLHNKITMDSSMDGGIGYFLTSEGSTVNNVYQGGRSTIHEFIPFHVTPQNLEVLAHTNTFQFRVNGDRQPLQRCTYAKNLRDLPEFLDAAKDYYQ